MSAETDDAKVKKQGQIDKAKLKLEELNKRKSLAELQVERLESGAVNSQGLKDLAEEIAEA